MKVQSSDNMWPEILIAVITGVIVYLWLTRKKIRALPMGDGWWGRGEKPDTEEDTTIHPFKVETSDAEINDLHRRLDAARYTEPLEDSFFHYGINTNYLKKVVSYWRNEFDWKKRVEYLNKFPHFKTKIEGIDVHYVHVKPSHVPEGQCAKPIVMVHGWPGSFYEFYKIIPILTDPVSHGLNGEHIFEVICPSIPGYGFSEAPHKKGFDSVSAARIFFKLMMRLGHKEFYIQGGDWGSVVCTNLAQIAPSHVKGIHLNMAPVTVLGPRHLLSVLFGQFFPRLFGFDDQDVRHFFPFTKKLIYKFANESGYFHIQATKPDSAGCALNDSPAGMAGCLLEKFSTWTNMKFLDLEDGGLEKKYSLDDLLTCIMIYWVSGCIVPSMRFYKENMKNGVGMQKHEWLPVYVPTGIAAFHKEMIHVPRAWAERKYVNIISYNHTSRGGHFAAFEEPAILAADILQFVEKVEQGKGKYGKCEKC